MSFVNQSTSITGNCWEKSAIIKYSWKIMQSYLYRQDFYKHHCGSHGRRDSDGLATF